MTYKIPLSYNPVDPEGLHKVLAQYKDRHHNDLILDFEKAVAAVTGARYVVALNSGAAAIHLGLKALGVGPGDEVLVSTFTYVATVNPILYLGAVPVFVDSEPDTWNMDPELLEQAVRDRLANGKKPRAMVVVHAYGMPAKMEEIMRISRQYGIPLLEDAAEALGSTYKDVHVGTFGEAGILSFNNNKIVTTFGGGALLTNKPEIAEKVLFWASQSREDLPYYSHMQVGYTYRMGPVNAAVGIYQLDLLEEKVRFRRKVFEQYKQALSGSGIKFPDEPQHCSGNRWLTTVVMDDRRARIPSLVKKMADEGIETRFLWNPMHKQRLFEGFGAFANGLSTRLFEKGLSLPSGDTLKAGQVAYVSEKLHAIIT